jgi:hypothetical protein
MHFFQNIEKLNSFHGRCSKTEISMLTKNNYFREVTNSHGSVIGLFSYSIFSWPHNSVHKSAIPSSIAFTSLYIAS